MAISTICNVAGSVSSFTGEALYFAQAGMVERPIPSGALAKNQVGARYELTGTAPLRNSPMTLQLTANVNAVGAATQFMSTLHVPVGTYLNSTEAELANPSKVDYLIVRVQVVSPTLAFTNDDALQLSRAIRATTNALCVYDDGSPAFETTVINRILRGGMKLS